MALYFATQPPGRCTTGTPLLPHRRVVHCSSRALPLPPQVINWSSLALHVPPVSVPRLPSILASAPLEQLRAAAVGMRRRLLWASIYGACHLAPGEGGDADAFDSLMQVRGGVGYGEGGKD